MGGGGGGRIPSTKSVDVDVMHVYNNNSPRSELGWVCVPLQLAVGNWVKG